MITHYNWKRTCGYNAPIPSDLKIGDIIAYHDNRILFFYFDSQIGGCSSEPVHMALVVKVDNGFAYVASHDDNVYSENHMLFKNKGSYISYLQYVGKK